MDIFTPCDQCGNPVSPERVANSHREHVFCCQKCRVEFHNILSYKKKKALPIKDRPLKRPLRVSIAESWVRDPGDNPMRDERPVKRGDCLHGERPCPWLSCGFHMFWALDKSRIFRTMRLSDDEVADEILSLPQTCVLDMADQGGLTLDEIGQILRITRERVRQIEDYRNGGAIRKLRMANKRIYLQDFVGEIADKGSLDEFGIETLDNRGGLW